jgi:hypothetical protein
VVVEDGYVKVKRDGETIAAGTDTGGKRLINIESVRPEYRLSNPNAPEGDADASEEGISLMKKSPAQLNREIAEALGKTRSHSTVKTDVTASSAAERPLKEKLQQAAKWIRRELNKRADRSHPSHLASKVLEEADEKFQLGSHGVEGWSKSSSLGYQYLNYGDPYDATIVVRSNPTRATVIVALGGWATYAGNS